MDIDKDIEYLKGYKYDNEVKQAIEKVLWALSGKDCVIETQAHNEEVLEEYIAKLEKELETYKKIAEFLADEGEFNSNKYCDEDGLVCMVKHPERECTKCIIDWARNEVKNEPI